MNRTFRKTLSVFLTFALTLGLLTVTASAADNDPDDQSTWITGNDVTLVDQRSYTLTDHRTNNLIIPTGATVTIDGGTHTLTGTLVLEGNCIVNITNLNITMAGINSAAIYINGAGNTINFSGSNTMTGFANANQATVCVPASQNAELTLTGDGTLNVSAFGKGAAIGGADENDCGVINITGGTITADASRGSWGAGIGGGSGSTGGSGGGGGSITISGNAIVTAKGGSGAAGIGGGNMGESGNITITGNANVTATGGDGYGDIYAGAGIGSGGGYDTSAAGTMDTLIINTTGYAIAKGGSSTYAGANIGSGADENGPGAVSIPTFIAAGSVNLNNPTDLVLNPEVGGTVTGTTLTHLYASKPGNPSINIFNMPPPSGALMSGLIAYNSSSKTLTIKAAAFGEHNGNPLTPGTYYLAIVLDSLHYYYAEITLIDGPPPPSGGGGGDTSSTYIVCNTIKIPYSKSGGAVSSDIAAHTLRDIADKAYLDETSGKTVKLDYSGISGMTGLSLTLDAALLGADEDITFIVETPFGVFIISGSQLRACFDNSKYTLTLEKSSLKLDIKQDGKSAVWDALTPMARIGVPYTPKTGENTATLAVTDKNGRVLPTSAYDKGMVYADIFAPGTYKAEQVAPAVFSDTSGHWAEQYIGYVTLRSLISGTDDAYQPETPITRADFMMALGKMSGADVSGYTSSGYSDVSNDSEAMPYIEWATENGIAQGIGAGEFAPDAEITREQMAQMMVNYARAIGYAIRSTVDPAPFDDDAQISGWAANAVKAIKHTGVIEGKPGNLFDPLGNATRAEAAAILCRYVNAVISSRDAEGWSNDNSDLTARVYYDQNGVRLTGWQTVDGERYWFDDKGVMASDKWAEIGG